MGQFPTTNRTLTIPSFPGTSNGRRVASTYKVLRRKVWVPHHGSPWQGTEHISPLLEAAAHHFTARQRIVKENGEGGVGRLEKSLTFIPQRE